MTLVRKPLSKYRPVLAKQWHPEKNAPLTPDSVGPRFPNPVVWRCTNDRTHEWQALITTRIAQGDDTYCPFCAGKRASPAYNLKRTHPEVAADWHPRKNGALKPSDVLPYSTRLVYWHCGRCGEDWDATIDSRTSAANGCPYCAGKRVGSKHNFARRYPALAKQWHPTKNRPLRASDVLPKSEKLIWWRCRKNPSHEFAKTVAHFTRFPTCPTCRAQPKRLPRALSFAHLEPAIAREWHPEKNGNLSPREVRPKSKRSVWWQCSKQKSHEWRTSPLARTTERTGCPFCAGRRLTRDQSIGARYPELVRQWHPTKNGTLTPFHVGPNSGRRVTWTCSRGPDHEWTTTVQMRVKNGKIVRCPFCTNHRVSVTNSVASKAPSVAARWDRRRNGSLRARDVTVVSSRRVALICPNGPDHQWDASIRDAVRSKASCPFCRGRRVSITNSLATLFPRIARQWHPTLNRDLTPKDVLAATTNLAWWKCPRGHAFQASVRRHVAGTAVCPWC